MKKNTQTRIRSVLLIASIALSACAANESTVLTGADHLLQEPEHVAMTPFTEVQPYPEFGILLVYGLWQDVIMIYDLANLTLKHTISFGDELARIVYPKWRDTPVRYMYSPPNEAIYLMPFDKAPTIQGHEIEAVRMIAKDTLACVMTVLGPWMIDREKDSEGFGRVPILFTYEVPTGTVSDISYLLPWEGKFVWNSVSINPDGRRVAIGMSDLYGRRKQGEMKMMVQSAGSTDYRTIFSVGIESEAHDNYVYYWRGDTLLFSYDLHNVFCYDGRQVVPVVEREVVEESLNSPYRITSITSDIDGRYILGLFTDRAKKKENKAVRLVIQESMITEVKEYDLNVPGRICRFSVSASDTYDMMFWLGEEEAYIRKPVQLETE